MSGARRARLSGRGKIISQGGQRYYIDDLYRKRPISPAVPAALKYPASNVYDVPASFLVQGGKLRWIANDAIFNALGLNAKYVFTVLSQYFKNYGVGQPVTAFKGARANVAASTNAAVGVAGSGTAPGVLSTAALAKAMEAKKK